MRNKLFYSTLLLTLSLLINVVLLVTKTSPKGLVPEKLVNSQNYNKYNKAYWETNMYIPTNVALNGICESDVDVARETFFKTYTVKSGDTLLSIAKNQLGSVNRVQELITLNTGKYPNFLNSANTKNNFLEVGWELLLPPTFVNKTSGFLYGWKGEVLDEDSRTITILTGNTKNIQTGTLYRVFTVDSDTKLFVKGNFTKGDCVNLIVDAGNGNKLVAISPQDKVYFK